MSDRVRFDWGLAGARALVADAEPGDVAVVVDVLSFTTTLTLALERGIEVLPYPWADEEAPAYAERHGALLARGRREGLATGSLSLSPASFEGAAVAQRVVLPSPNGSTIAFALAESGVRVVGACLRNAAAVGERLRDQPGRVLVVAAGEHWPGGELRPAVEDLWGAGAVLAALGADASPDANPEARAAVAAYDVARDRIEQELADCMSGRELVSAGFARDVTLAAATDVARVVPVLRDRVFGAG